MSYRGILPAMLFGVLAILIIGVSISFLVSILLKFTSLSESSFSWFLLITSFLALFIGGMISGGKAGEKGWLVGASTGIFYSIVIFLAQFLGYNRTFTTEQYLYHGGYILFAILGGIIGVNLLGNKSEAR
ncbi:TIGR04086 family membrane protein [Anaerobacillus sp. MEB173]|uniref:TIGR04086 family membrane protein n=1 Tax=Anaerobacillus sp. MEB173 TaxID=3383345 RepID=UPI003F935327